MSERLSVKPVSSWGDRRRFQRLPWTIYAGDRNWVPPLLGQERQLLGWGKHPFYDNAEGVTLLAQRGSTVVGRVAVLVNPIHNQKYSDRVGFFGFFECANDDVEAARALFDAGGEWLRSRGMQVVRGPVNPSLNYTCGLLVDGFDRSPCFLMTHNPPTYAALLESCGFTKSQDLYAYEVDPTLVAGITERYKEAVLAALSRSGLVIRPFDPKRYEEEIATYLDIYNQSLEGTWGFAPVQQRESRLVASELRHLLVPQFAVFAEIEGRPVGAMLALLDYNQVLRKLNGRLFPFGFVRLLTGKRRITAARVMAMNMLPAYRSSGLGIVLLDHLVIAGKEWGVTRYEFSWVLESNARSRGSLERAGTRRVATYRIYDKPI